MLEVLRRIAAKKLRLCSDREESMVLVVVVKGLLTSTQMPCSSSIPTLSVHCPGLMIETWINIPEYVMPATLDSFNKMIQKKSTSILQQERIKLKEQFSKTAGFLDVRQYDELIYSRLRAIIENDYTIKAFLEKIDNLVKGEGDEVSFS